ncbi:MULTISPECIES: ABC transporter permease [Pseudomonas syringae group]|uniref:ABC transporter permease n=1 Tax=Pseudomonas syringae group TaxID=136849 RepID=UPI0013C2B349|nr:MULTISPECIES: ABC transporter permease [Pseudomonas]MCD5972745.1 ABC transporter permease [Pseudomonas quasicaspiana]
MTANNVSLSTLAKSSAGTAALLYIVLLVAYVSIERSALSVSAFSDLVNNAAPLAIAAAGGTLIVLLRGFDLSVAGIISLVNVILATHPMDDALGALGSLGLALSVGAGVGLINGALIAYGGFQSIAITLATMIMTGGLALVVLDAPGGAVADWLSENLTDTVAGFPVSGLVMLAVVGLWAIARKTNFGVSLYAVGQDEHAAALSGIEVKRTRCLAFVFAGALYGLSGFMLSAQTATGNPTAGNSLLLLTFAAIALGGTSFRGGKGGLTGSIIGAASLMLLQKLLFSVGVQSFYIGLLQGVVMILAVGLMNAGDRFGVKRA